MLVGCEDNQLTGRETKASNQIRLREGEPVVVEGAFTVKSVLLRGTIAEE